MSLSADHNHSYGPEDIRRYLNGEMSGPEMHAFERAMHEDPFLEDAVEGMRDREPASLSGDTAELRNRIADRVDDTVKRMPVPGKWWRYAAAAALMGFIGFTAWFFNAQNGEEVQISKREERIKDKSSRAIVQADTTAGNNEDSASINMLSKQEPIPEKSAGGSPVPSTQKSITEPARELNPVKGTADQTASAPPPVTGNEIKPADKPKLLKIETDSDPPGASALILSKNQEKKPEQNRQFPQESMRARLVPSSGKVIYFTGRVTDSSHKPIPFANLSSLDNNSLTYTDAQGNFRLMVADTTLDIHVKSIGYTLKKSTLNHRQPFIQIILEVSKKETAMMLNEVSPVKSFREIDSTADDSAHTGDFPEAEPADGWGLYHMYLMNNLRMPGDAALNRIHGTATVSFMVNEQGWLYNFRVDKSLCPSCDREAIRLIREGPRWVLYNSDEPLRASVTVIF